MALYNSPQLELTTDLKAKDVLFDTWVIQVTFPKRNGIPGKLLASLTCFHPVQFQYCQKRPPVVSITKFPSTIHS